MVPPREVPGVSSTVKAISHLGGSPCGNSLDILPWQPMFGVVGIPGARRFHNQPLGLTRDQISIKFLELQKTTIHRKTEDARNSGNSLASLIGPIIEGKSAADTRAEESRNSHRSTIEDETSTKKLKSKTADPDTYEIVYLRIKAHLNAVVATLGAHDFAYLRIKPDVDIVDTFETEDDICLIVKPNNNTRVALDKIQAEVIIERNRDEFFTPSFPPVHLMGNLWRQD